ncbi:MAG: lipoyl(octanoyl) transferase LipB [Bdellovibrionota bacterium]
MSNSIRIFSLPGLVPYQEASELQKKLVDFRATDRIPDTILFLEHEPVITRGRGLQGPDARKQMPLATEDLPPMIQYAETERGGDLTYHGPGQLVIYPIVKLDGKGFAPERDVGAFIRKLEQLLIDLLWTRGLSAKTKKNATGVWVGEHKLASIGIAVRKWVAYHGISINVVNHLAPFHLFAPCGFDGKQMTRLADLTPDTLDSTNWRRPLEESLADAFGQSRIEVARNPLSFVQVAPALDISTS